MSICLFMLTSIFHEVCILLKNLGMQYIEILVKLRKIIRSINLESKKIEKKFGISIPQLMCLQFLSEQAIKVIISLSLGLSPIWSA